MNVMRGECKLDMEMNASGTEYMTDYFSPHSALKRLLKCAPHDLGEDIQYVFTTQYGVATLYRNRKWKKYEWHIGATNTEACNELANFLDNNLVIPAVDGVKQQIEALDDLDLKILFEKFNTPEKHQEQEFLLRELGFRLGTEELLIIIKAVLKKRQSKKLPEVA